MSYNRKKDTGGSLKFEDTYLGYSDEEEDAFNSETFGGDIPVGQDFNFGGAPSQPQAEAPQSVNYAAASSASLQPASALNDDPLKPISSLWGDNSSSNQQASPQHISSLDEIEAQLTQSRSAPPPQQQQFQQGLPPPLYAQPPSAGNFFYPPGFMVPQQGPPPPGLNNFPPQFNLNQIPVQQFQQLPPQVQHQLIQQAQFAQQQQQVQGPPVGVPGVPPQGKQFEASQQLPQAPVAAPPLSQATQGSESPAERSLQQAQTGPQFQESAKQDLSQFPVLGSDEANHLRDDHHHQHQQHHAQNQQSNHRRQSQYNDDHHQQNNHNGRNHRHQYGSQHHENFNELPEEEQARLIKRQQKVHRILQFTGIMTPRDKDFVTRIQLSHIVTDDPYNEDFYFQVYRLLKTGDHNINNNSIAQAYLDFSGHKLGGRYQRADLALQRMQQQVQKAVTVAKERPKTTQFTKEGALGKVSLVSGKLPRKQLEIVVKRPELPEISKGGKKTILLLIENVCQQVLSLESDEREGKPLDTDPLWESLRLFDNVQQLNPFIQSLSYEKGLKIFPRIFHFLDRQQKLTIVTLIFANLSLIKIITKSSFKNHENDVIPSSIQKTIELFQLVVLKPIILFLSYEAALTEIIGLLTILVEHNNISFLSTSKLGISLLTILLSRAEIIKQEQAVSSEDLQHWANAYESLFTSLENKLPLIFPSSKLNVDDSYIWQFLASLALSGKINHQRIIVDEIRDEIFGSIAKAKASEPAAKLQIITNLNLFLNVIGLSATEDEIVELK